MRPRLITAENVRHAVHCMRPVGSFNEAAAHHRGELERMMERALCALLASMRPRLITAENPLALVLQNPRPLQLQ